MSNAIPQRGHALLMLDDVHTRYQRFGLRVVGSIHYNGPLIEDALTRGNAALPVPQ